MDSSFQLELYNRKSLLHDPRTWLILLAFCEKNIVRYGLLVLTMMTGEPAISEGLLGIVYVSLIIACIKRGSSFHPNDILFLSSVIAAIFFTCLFYPDNSQFIFDENNFWNAIFPCLRFFIVGLFIIPDKELSNLLGVVSCFSLFVEIIFLFAYLKPAGLVDFDDMSRSYQILLNVLFILNTAFNKKTLLWTGISIASLLYLFSLGTRGPIMILLTYMFLKFIQVGASKKIAKITVGLLVGGILLLFSSSSVYLVVLEFLRSLLDQWGMSTRIFDLAIEGDIIEHTSGRDEIYELALKKILEQPIFGYGVYGEWPWNGWNIHNMYLELLLHFGVILGSVIIVWMVVLSLRTYFRTRNIIAQEFILMWATCVFIKGIFGGSYFQLHMFLLIGFLLAESRRLKNYKYD